MKGLEAEKLPGSVGWGEGRSLQAEGHGDRRAACLRDDRAPRDCCYSLRAGEETCGSLVQTDDRGPGVSVESRAPRLSSSVLGAAVVSTEELPRGRWWGHWPRSHRQEVTGMGLYL